MCSRGGLVITLLQSTKDVKNAKLKQHIYTTGHNNRDLIHLQYSIT